MDDNVGHNYVHSLIESFRTFFCMDDAGELINMILYDTESHTYVHKEEF